MSDPNKDDAPVSCKRCGHVWLEKPPWGFCPKCNYGGTYLVAWTPGDVIMREEEPE